MSKTEIRAEANEQTNRGNGISIHGRRDDEVSARSRRGARMKENREWWWRHGGELRVARIFAHASYSLNYCGSLKGLRGSKRSFRISERAHEGVEEAS